MLAGPGAGKTFCLTERIRFLIEELGFDPARICAFTFTNKAAGEIAHRLEQRLGDRAAKIKRGTIHAFCAELLRELGTHVLLEPGFGIADENYQLHVLARVQGRALRRHRRVLNRFSAHRFRGDPLGHEDTILFDRYQRFLAKRRVVDFDSLVIKAAELLEGSDRGASIRSRWDVILVDEFQDVNPVQYRVVRALAQDHGHVFAVGDDEQSIYSWAGADPAVFKSFSNDFRIERAIHLEENYRCARDVFDRARRLMTLNPSLFGERVLRAERPSPFPITTVGFENDDQEIAWLIEDIRRDRAEHGLDWGDVALLYRKHEIGDLLEAACLNASIPCRLAQGRALAEDPVVMYVLAALRVIANPNDDVHRDAFFAVVLPRPLYDEARARAEVRRHNLRRELNSMSTRYPRAHENGRQIRRALTDWRNLDALGKNHTHLGSLVQELLSRRVGKLRSVLDERHDEISDPAALPDVVALASRLVQARERHAGVWMPRMGGVDIALKGLLTAIGFKNVQLGGECPPGGERLVPEDVPSVGLALGVFKAAQLAEIDEFGTAFSSFTAIDLETTDNDTTKAEIVEIAAVRVRDGVIVETFSSLVRPGVPIAPKAAETHGITEEMVSTAPAFAEVWPTFRDFCGEDVVVAHNGYEFDFRILTRMVKSLGGEERFDLTTYDTLPLARDLYPTSRKLVDLARQFGIPPGQSHRALDDTLALANIVLALDDEKRKRARKTALVNVLDYLGMALALCEDASLCEEARMIRGFTRPFALGRYSGCLEFYEREQGNDLSIPTVDEVIEALGGAELMVKIRTDKTADERYPAAMQRLRRLIAEIPAGALGDQIALLLERAVLSAKWDGIEPDRGRVNLLTLHSTKGLEFSRVYVVGVEDGQLPGGTPTNPARPDEIEEARRLLYVGMTRTKDRLVMTRAVTRGGRETRGHQFLDEMGIVPQTP